MFEPDRPGGRTDGALSDVRGPLLTAEEEDARFVIVGTPLPSISGRVGVRATDRGAEVRRPCSTSPAVRALPRQLLTGAPALLVDLGVTRVEGTVRLCNMPVAAGPFEGSAGAGWRTTTDALFGEMQRW